MFSLAAKLAVTIAITGAQTCDSMQAAAVSSRERVVWNEIRPSIVTLYGNGHATGVAALIDDSGYFVAHKSSVAGVQVFGTTSTGKQLTFSIVSKDDATSLVLLKTNLWPSGSARVFRPPTLEDMEGSTLIAVLPTGPMRMAYGSKHKLGVLSASRRLVPLTEMRFEASGQPVGGALIFSDNGELIGSLNATLVVPEDANQNSVRDANQNSLNGFGGQGGFGGAQSATAGGGGSNGPGGFGGRNQQYSNSGPTGLTVAYTVSPDFVQHVLEGFLSPSHTVEFAALGVFCKDAIGGGALIQAVTPGSPAERSGLKPGDILMNINQNPIPDQVAFAKVMLQQKVGVKISLIVKRGPGQLFVDIVPAKAAD